MAEDDPLRILYGYAARQSLAWCFVISLTCGLHWAGIGSAFMIVLLALLGLLLSIAIETRIGKNGQWVERRWAFFGRVPIYRRRFQVCEFASVGVEACIDLDDACHWQVRLNRKSGLNLEVQWFDDDKAEPERAMRMAQVLAEATGLSVAVAGAT